MKDTFVDWLIDIMKKKGLTQATLAKRGDVSRTAISNLLNGSRGAGINLLSAIARGLDIPLEIVLEEYGIRKPDPDKPPGIEEWIYLYINASEIERQEMLDYARYKNQRRAANG
jgi:transcriptional regulator with XRE-family HTH domain